MKTIRTILVMIALIMTLIPSTVFADADEELPKADNLEAEETVEEETEVITAPEPEKTQDIEATDTETVSTEEPVVMPEPEAPVIEIEPSGPQHEDTASLKETSPFEISAERLRADGYADVLDLRINESECDALFAYITSLGIIKDGYELSILSEDGLISHLFLSKEEADDPKTFSQKQKGEASSKAEQSASPAEDTEPIIELTNTEETPASDPEGEGSSMPLASFYGSLMLLIGAVKHILF